MPAPRPPIYPCRVASTKTLNAHNLAALGAARLAELLLDISAGDAAAKRRLRLELAGTMGADEVSREVGKRLATLAKARSFVEWDKVGALAVDLATQRRAIVDQVGKDEPAEALSLLWRFLALARPVLGRCDDGNGRIGDLFRDAAGDLAPLARRAGATPLPLADRVFEALRDNGHGQYDELIDILGAGLGGIGLERLKALFTAWGAEQPPKLAASERHVVGWGSRGAMYADELEDFSRTSSVRLALRQIADAQGDVDGFIAQYDARARKAPAVAADIGRRLLGAGRPKEALATLDAAEVRGGQSWPEWEHTRVDALIALGRGDDARAFRWERFLATLSARHLRAYLKALFDFDDIEAEERAMAHARRHAAFHAALAFLIGWPALDQAGRLVLDRAAEVDGNAYELLTTAADALEHRHPLAATLLLRAMIDFSLARARATRYGHAARHLATCASLASRIDSYGASADHETYVSGLRAAHGRKAGFWRAA